LVLKEKRVRAKGWKSWEQKVICVRTERVATLTTRSTQRRLGDNATATTIESSRKKGRKRIGKSPRKGELKKKKGEKATTISNNKRRGKHCKKREK